MLKATGIVRRIDDLGRVVIPKEIRRTMRIREGDPLEIYTDNNGEVIFKKYSPIGELSTFAGQCTEVLSKTSGCPAAVCDRDRIIAVSGIPKKELLDKKITPQLEEIIDNRVLYAHTVKDQKKLIPAEGIDRYAITVCPILSGGDISGAVLFLSGEMTVSDEVKNRLIQAMAMFLGKQLEE